MKVKRMPKIRLMLSALICVLGVYIISLGVWMDTLHLSNIKGRSPGVANSHIELPWRFDKAGYARMSANLAHWPGGVARWHIIADNEVIRIRVNGRAVDLSHIGKEKLSDYKNGFSIDLSGYLVFGANSLTVVINNYGGPGALSITPEPSFKSHLLIAVGLCFLAFSLSCFIKVSRAQFVIGLLSIGLMVVYISKTAWDQRTYDTDGDSGHYGYIEYIVEKKSLPAPNAGWTFYHPPLYYLSASLVVEWARYVHVDEKKLLQVYSAALWIVFLMASFAVFRLTLSHSEIAINTASAALAFWPSGIIHGIRLGNDVAFYALSGLAFWAILTWWKTDSRRCLILAALFCMLGLLTKSNSIIFSACLGLCIAFKFFEHSGWVLKKRKIADAFIACMFIAAGIALSFANRIYYYNQGEIEDWLISNSNALHGGLLVSNNIAAYIPFDIATFVANPFIDAWEDDFGRNNFWNFLLRTSLTGTFIFGGVLPAVIAVVYGLILIALLWISVGKWIRFKWLSLAALKQSFPVSALILHSLVALIAVRIRLPYSCSGEFRYILPILPALFIYTCQQGKVSQYLHWVISVLTAVFFLAI